MSGEPRKDTASLTRPKADSPAGTVQSFASASQNGFPRFSAEGGWARAEEAETTTIRPDRARPAARDGAGALADRPGDAEGRRRGEPADERRLQGAAHGRAPVKGP